MKKGRGKRKVISLAVAVALLLVAPLTSASGNNAPSEWSKSEVERAISLGLVPSSLQARYTEPMTRAEFCAVAVLVYEIASGNIINYRRAFRDTIDVNVQKMGGLGVISGIGDNLFAPDDKLTRQEAATILSRLMVELSVPLVTRSPGFADNAEIAGWAFTAVGQMQATGIMVGTGNNRFSPLLHYSIEQGIYTLLKVYDLASKIKLEEIVDAAPPLAGFFELDENSDLKRFAAEVMECVNTERIKAGLTGLIGMELLSAAATVRAAECETLYSHIRPDGRDFSTILADLSINSRGVGETLYRGALSAEQAVRGWMDSPVHKECILIPIWEKMGVGIHRGSDGTLYWALILIV